MKTRDQTIASSTAAQSAATPSSGPEVSRPAAESPKAVDAQVARPAQEGPRATFAAVKPPALNLPQGGGAMRSIGETFRANPVTGTASASIPLPITPPPRGPAPAVSLSYDSGSGNGLFGHGWSLSVPQIVRRTDNKLPEYLDSEDSDEFLFGGEALVPLFDGDTRWSATRTEGEIEYRIERFRPRIEGAFTIVEKWTAPGNVVHWRALGADNSTTLFGTSGLTRIAAPSSAKRVYAWLVAEMRDDRGHIVTYAYDEENLVGVEDGKASELSRKNGLAPISNKHLKRVRYCNELMNDPESYVLELVFDYGDHDENEPAPMPDGTWTVRVDPFSSHRPGFDMRTYRLCRRVLMFHHFTELGAHHLVRSLNLTYKEDDPKLTQLLSAKVVGYTWDLTASEYTRTELPSVSFEYTTAPFTRQIATIGSEETRDMNPLSLNTSSQWVDLDGEGLPGVLTHRRGAVHYKRNEGAQLRPGRVLDAAPNLAPGSQLMDVGGSGTMAMVRLDPRGSGYQERTADGWGPFRTFASNPNVDFASPNLRMVDLNGDGFDDILLTHGDHFVWYPSLGKDGWGAAQRVPVARDQEEGPAVIFAGRYSTIFLADMTGDGLADIVRVTHGQVCYWPNVGHGRFGAQHVMEGSPKIDRADWFHPSRIRLADLDGTGTADLVYFDAKGMHIWLNQAGNGYSAELLNDSVPVPSALPTLSIVDLHGVGMGTVVWAPARPSQTGELRHTSPFGIEKPFLLKTMRNGMGLEVSFEYQSSTRSYLADRAAGRPWATKLPFPVQVLTKVTSHDHVSSLRLVTEYRYHHGHYDTAEREFRGFGMVESEDAESTASGTGAGQLPEMPLNEDGELAQAPVLTKTWFHTGAWLEKGSLEAAFEAERWSGDPPPAGAEPARCVIPTGLKPAEVREAYRALKGTMLRQEVYGLDDLTTPYVVRETSYEIKRLQPKKAGRDAARPRLHAVFQVLPRESREHTYDRVANDPRVTQWVALKYDDDYGFVTTDLSIAYGRREAQRTAAEAEGALAGLGLEPLEEQGRAHAVVTETTIAHAVEVTSGYRLGIPVETKTYELTGILGSTLQTVDTLRSSYDGIEEDPVTRYHETPPSGLQRRLIEHVKIRYYDSDTANFPDPLGFGGVDAMALPYEAYHLDLTDGLLEELEIEDKITTAVLTEGGYVELDEGEYWLPSGTSVLDPARFYLPTELHPPLGGSTELTYTHDMFVTGVVDALGNSVTSEIDYRVLSPCRVTDANGNPVEAAFDDLGRVTKIAVLGGDTLANPTVEFSYFTDRWAEDPPLPNYVHSRARKQHGVEEWQESYVYSDGSGNVAMTKVQAEPGLAPTLDENGDPELDGTVPALSEADPRWVGTGRTIRNNKGSPIKQYEPYFSRTHEYETDENLVHWGVTPVMHYDPVGRVTRVDLPNGTYRKTVHGVWRAESWDENDTLSDETNLYRIEQLARASGHPERVTCERAMAHGGTFSRAYVDALGRPFLGVAHNIDLDDDAEYIATRTSFDIEGQPLAVTDPLGRACQTHAFSIGGRLLIETNIDKGTRWNAATVLGEPLRQWQERDASVVRTFRTTFDVLRRPKKLFVKIGSAAETLLEHRFYGDDAGIVDPEDDNLRGKLVALYDGGGLLELGPYDFKGNLLESARTLADDHAATPDWMVTDTETAAADAKTEALTATLLEPETFTETREYDALNRVTSSLNGHDNTRIIPTYNDAGLLETVAVEIRGATPATLFVKDIDYNEKGQRTRIEYSDGAPAPFATDYTYDRLTFRLSRIRTVRDDDEVLQDLSYNLDPVGNIVRVEDGAQQELFYDDEFVAPVNHYFYDAVYRLVKATGREHKSIGDVQVDDNDQPIRALPLATDPNAVRTYEETYLYDTIGNFIEMFHDADAGTATWRREYDYVSGTNRLATTTAPGGSVAYDYDQHGNMVAMPHLPTITYSPFDQMESADRDGGGMVYFNYSAGGQRVRKVWEETGSIRHETIYLGGFEIYRRLASGTPTIERQTVHVMDGIRRIAMVETKTVDTSGPFTVTPRIRFQLDNHLGSAMLELTETGQIISYEEYHPYGTSAYRSSNGSVEVSARRYRYTGKERDEETGLYYYGARYYACWLGRWTSADPSGIGADGPGLYNYTRGSPVTLTDPNGRDSGVAGASDSATGTTSWVNWRLVESLAAHWVDKNLFTGSSRERAAKRERAVGYAKGIGGAAVDTLEVVGNDPLLPNHDPSKPTVASNIADAVETAWEQGTDPLRGLRNVINVFNPFYQVPSQAIAAKEADDRGDYEGAGRAAFGTAAAAAPLVGLAVAGVSAFLGSGGGGLGPPAALAGGGTMALAAEAPAAAAGAAAGVGVQGLVVGIAMASASGSGGSSAEDRAREVAANLRAEPRKVKTTPKSHHQKHDFNDAQVRDIVANADEVYLSEGKAGRLIFRQGGTIVVVEGPGSSQGNIITAYGTGGIKAESGVKAVGGLPTDPAPPVTDAMITTGTIPSRGVIIPKASSIWKK